jgi:heptaprenyl diphosphate synthase
LSIPRRSEAKLRQKGIRLVHKRLAQLSVLAAVAVAIYSIEAALPRPFPWLRLGLSNAIVLTVLTIFGFRDALMVSLVRTGLGSLVVGTLFTPGFLMGLTGGVASVVAMGAVLTLGGRIFSSIGISVCGAIAHQGTQLLVASVILIGSSGALALGPTLGLLAVATGILTGFISLVLIDRLTRTIG